MATWYRASFSEVEPVEVERDTAESVFINGKRKAKVSDYYCYFPSESEAVAFVLDRQGRKVKNLRDKLQVEERQHAKLIEKFAPPSHGEG